jgi:hypothetical protein
MFEEIRDLFLIEHGSFAKFLQFKTLIIVIVILVFFNTFFEKSYGFVIILLVFAIYIANQYVIIRNNKTQDFNRITMMKLSQLQKKSLDYITDQIRLMNSQVSKGGSLSQKDIDKLYKRHELSSLYVDANLIHFLFSVIKLYDYNPGEYYSLLQGTNNILKIKSDIDTFYESNGEYPENTSELLQSALELKQKTINNMHNFIYTVPKMNIMYNYINDSIERYSILISRVTDDIYKSYKKNINQKGINSSTKFVNYNTTKHFDEMDNYSSIPTSESKIINFYI